MGGLTAQLFSEGCPNSRCVARILRKLKDAQREHRARIPLGITIISRPLPHSAATDLVIIDQLRWHLQRAGDVGLRFVELVQSVDQNNDRRAEIKRRINERLGSRILEEQFYAEASSASPYG